MLIVTRGVLKGIYSGRGPEIDVLCENVPELPFSLFFPFNTPYSTPSLSVGLWWLCSAQTCGLLEGQDEGKLRVLHPDVDTNP